MGLFDGVKEAFGADGMGDLDSERETPIDRWMGWNTKKTDGAQPKDVVGSKGEFYIYVYEYFEVLDNCKRDLCILTFSKYFFIFLHETLSLSHTRNPYNILQYILQHQ